MDLWFKIAVVILLLVLIAVVASVGGYIAECATTAITDANTTEIKHQNYRIIKELRKMNKLDGK